MSPDQQAVDNDAFFMSLDQTLDQRWTEMIRQRPLLRAIDENRISRRLYAMYMVETYHYTAHNARNQALVGVRPEISAPYMKFCLEHASEEVGHEKMALHDILSMGLRGTEVPLPAPLLETELLMSYVYWVSLTGNPLQRLGYSYWAESCYRYINPLIAKLRTHLKLESAQLTFFIAHSDIDAGHFEEVKAIIRRTCRTQADLEAVTRVMENTLDLTANMLDAVYADHERHLAGTSRRCEFLSALGD